MNRNRSVKPGTIILFCECVFLALVFLGYWMLSSTENAKPQAAVPAAVSPPDPTSMATSAAPSMADAIDRPAPSREISNPSPIDLDLAMAETPVAETPVAKTLSIETPLPNASMPEPASAITTPPPRSDSSRPDRRVQIGPMISFQLNAESRRRFFRDSRISGPNTDDWWLPMASTKAFVFKSRDKINAIYSVSLDTGRCTQLANFPQHRYIDAYGDASEIYLLRFDTSDKRFRLIADVFSLQTIRITSTRTLLDLPPLRSKRIDRFVWDPVLGSLALTLAENGSRNETKYATHLVNLQTGARIESTSDDYSIDNSVPLKSSRDGRRLYLAPLPSSSSEKSKVDGDEVSLTELNLSTNEIKSFGSSKLPKRNPLQISTDARWTVYANGNEFEVWNTQTGLKQTTFSSDWDSTASGRRPRMSFSAGGQWIAYDNGGSLKIHSTDGGALLATFPETNNAGAGRSASMTTLFSTAADSDLLIFGINAELRSPDPSSRADGDAIPSPWFRRVSVAIPDAKIGGVGEAVGVPSTKEDVGDVGKSTAGFTEWMTAGEYDTVFAQMTSKQMYIDTVEGRFHRGQRQYRARFIERPKELGFYSRHDRSEDVINGFARQYHRRGFREVWRHSFVDNEGIAWWSAIWTTPPTSEGKSSSTNSIQ